MIVLDTSGLLAAIDSSQRRHESAGGPQVRSRAAASVPIGLGIADASVVVIAARAGTNRILTLDERHFGAIPPLRDRTFLLLPRD